LHLHGRTVFVRGSFAPSAGGRGSPLHNIKIARKPLCTKCTKMSAKFRKIFRGYFYVKIKKKLALSVVSMYNIECCDMADEETGGCRL